MEELIKLRKSSKTGDYSIVNARDLYKFLEVGMHFADWIKPLIDRWGFIENQDYARLFYDKFGNRIPTSQKQDMEECVFASNVYSIEYALTIDTAKEISMVQNSAKGKEARRYFIAKEKELQELKLQQASQPVLNASITTFTIAEVAKASGNSSRKLNKILRLNKYFKPNNKPYEKWFNQGLFVYKSYNPKYSSKQLRITSDKGIPVIQQLLSSGKQLTQPENVNVNQPISIRLIDETRLAKIENARMTKYEETMVALINYVLAGSNRDVNPETQKIELDNYRTKLRNLKAELEK